MLVHGHLRDAARAFPDKLALIERERQLSFAEADEQSNRLACELQRLGVRRGDRVAAMLENSVEMVIALWAALKAGAVFVPINHVTKSGTLGFVLADADVTCLVTHTQFKERVAAARLEAPEAMTVIWTGAGASECGLTLEGILGKPLGQPADPKLIDLDLALLIYTSGSTGKPKGVMMTHRNIDHNMWSISTYLGNSQDDIALCVLPLSFDYGLFQVLTGARARFTVVLERSFAFPYEVLKQIGKHRVTILPGVPTIFAKLLEFAPFRELDLSSLRAITNTAAAFPPAHIRKFRSLLPNVRIFSMYGVTESTRVAYLDPAQIDTKIASVGRAMPNTETYIVDEEGRRLGPNEIGELVVRGSSVMRGYWKRPEETARALRDCDAMPGEKVFHTGDLFWKDGDGDLYFVGRRDDVFKCRGEKVSPKEVENVLYELDEIAETAVIGVPDPIDGMAVKAYVVLREGHSLTAQALRRHCHAGALNRSRGVSGGRR